MLAAVGAGAFTSIEEAAGLITTSGRIEPEEAQRRIYKEGAALFSEIYTAVEPLYTAQHRLESLSGTS